MKDFQFSFPTQVIFGCDAEQKVGEMAKCYGKKALILYGSERIQKNGLLKSIQQQLDRSGVSSECFGGISENPLLAVAEKASKLAKEQQIDLLIAVGGGSVIDTAKAVSVGACSDASIWDFYSQKAEPDKALPIGVVLTMAATASEANCVSVLTNENINKKAAWGCPLLFPKFALMNPELTYSVPKTQTAIGAIDIFAHAFERYFHLEQKGTLRTQLCMAVMKTVLIELPKVMESPQDYESRSQLMWAATMAHSDMIGTEGVFACHEMSHLLTEEFDLPHGAALAILMPAWCKYMLTDHAKEIAEFATDIWDVASEHKSPEIIAQEGISRFQNYICKSGLPVTLREAGIIKFDSRELAEKTMEETAFLGENFKKLYHKDLQAIYELARG